MITKHIALSATTMLLVSALSGCNSSNDEGLDELGVEIVDIPLVCQMPDTIKVDSLGNSILDENGAPSCERVELSCIGQGYDPITHSCESLGRHENAPLEVAGAHTEGRDDFATIFFTMEGLSESSVDDGFVMHAWNNANCDAYDPDYIEPGQVNDYTQNDYWDTDWATGIKPDGFDPNYGLYWTFRLLENHSECANFIIHQGNTRWPDGGDLVAYLARDPESARYNEDRMSYVSAELTPLGAASLFPYYSEEGDKSNGLRETQTEQAVHWFNLNTLLINDEKAEKIRLYATKQMPLLFPGEGFRGLDYVEFTRSSDELSQSELDRALYRKGLSQFALVDSLESEVAKSMLQGRLVATLVDENNEEYTGYLVQTAGVLDELYTHGDSDADEAPIGLQYEDSSLTASVWAPTALEVKLALYGEKDANGDYPLLSTKEMTFDTQTGLWSYQGSREELDRVLYRYHVDVFHPVTNTFEQFEVVDPYAVSLTTNGRYGRFVDLNDTDLIPAWWQDHEIPAQPVAEDIVIYEGHIRDFSILDESTSEANRGKYLAFTEQNSVPVNHLKALKEAGISHFQVLPANDIATINEDGTKQVNLNSTVANLCELESELAICSEFSSNTLIADAFASYEPTSESLTQAINALSANDSFNWGYDPYVFNTPEGSYASDAESVSRIVEMRAMVQSLHEYGLRVSLDVVYNHTSSSGIWDNSVLDKVVPGYYHRKDITTGQVLTDSCCQDTASENRMFAKLITDSLVQYAEQYKFDAFRFDLMGMLPQDLLLAAREKVRTIDPDTYFYGEGWNVGKITDIGATQVNLSGSEIGTFSDRQREGVRRGAFFNSDGSSDDVDLIRMGLVANISNYVMQNNNGLLAELGSYSWHGYAKDPADVINYVGKHDGQTLWDKLQTEVSNGYSSQQRARIHSVAGSFPILSQGIPFIQMGQDLLRSKSLHDNSYDAGDWINKLDFTKDQQNYNTTHAYAHNCSWENCQQSIAELLLDTDRKADNVDIQWSSNIYADLLAIRASSKLFRLNSAQQIIDRVGFHNTGKDQVHGVIAMSIDDGAGCMSGTLDLDGNCQQADLRPDIDENFDGIIVVFNGTSNMQTVPVPSAQGFELHSIQLSSQDNQTASSTVTENATGSNFNVSAFTTAVFVKAQGETQGTGISAFASVGGQDIAPYGATTVYIRGDFNGWATTNPTDYQGEGVYETTITLEAGSYGFKLAADDWSYPSLGGDIEITLRNETLIGQNQENLSVTIPADGDYRFRLDASVNEAPLLTIEPAISEPVYDDTRVYIRGTLNQGGGWNTNNPMLYIGDGIYVASLDLTAGEYQFKFASEDWSTVNFGVNGSVAMGLDSAVTLDGSDNVNITIPTDGQYTFVIDASNADLPTILVNQDTQPYDSETIIVKGLNGDWGDTHAMTYYGNGNYGLRLSLQNNTEFKIANTDWAIVNFGGSGLTLGQPLLLDSPGDNIQLIDFTPGDMQFIFKVINEEAQQVSVTVTEAL